MSQPNIAVANPASKTPDIHTPRKIHPKRSKGNPQKIREREWKQKKE